VIIGVQHQKSDPRLLGDLLNSALEMRYENRARLGGLFVASATNPFY
jgi:hypothetical protein